MRVAGNFLAIPAPAVQIEEPSSPALEAKRAFEVDRLKAWFGR
jgi:hypothetical protein